MLMASYYEEQNMFLASFGGDQKHLRDFMRTLAKPGELWRTHDATFTRTSLTFTRVPAKVPRGHQSSGEGALGMWVASRMCPNVAKQRTCFLRVIVLVCANGDL